jgi:c-di-GMP-binding flagellar brake protein YcgR
MPMAGSGWWRAKATSVDRDARTATQDGPPPPSMGVDVAYPMQRVIVRWHTLDGGEVAIPGQIQDVDGEIVEVWFDRNSESYDPLRSDDRVWIDALDGNTTYVFAGWIIGMRPPDTLVINVDGLPRRDQRRQYVREIVTLPPQPVVTLDEFGEPDGMVVEALVNDLSGGGIRLQMDAPVPKGTKLLITIDLTGDEPFDATVTVVDALQSLNGAHIIRGHFSSIDERRRRDIIRYVFREQIKKSRLAPPLTPS